jgi:hypothetical protein
MGPAHFSDDMAAQNHGTIGVDTTAHHQPTSKVHTGSVRYTVGQDEAAHSGHASHQIAPSVGTAGGSVLASLQKQGPHQSVELIPGDPSSRTLVDVAIRQGLLTRNAAGQLEDSARQQEAIKAALQPEQDQQQNDPGAGVFDSEDDQLWAEDIEPLPQSSYDAAVASTIGAIAHGNVDLEQTALSLARNAGIAPELAHDYVQAGIEMHERVVARALGTMGLEGERLEAAYEFMRGQPDRLQAAMQQLAYGRDVSGFKALAVDFKVKNPGDLLALKAAGMETHVDRQTGDVYVRHGGGSWRRMSELGK